jgi:hypothetical protein
MVAKFKIINFMKTRIFCLFICFVLYHNAIAQGSLTPKYSNEFLAIGVSARGLALGGAMSSVTDDVTSAYWNPAGLLNIKSNYQGALTHNQYFGGIASYNYGGFAARLDETGVLAFSVIRMGVDGIPNTLNLRNPDGSFNFDNVSSFSEASYAFMFSYARESKLIKNLRTAANVKVIHRNAGTFATAWGFGVDIGGQLTVKEKWHIGFMARDITTTFNTWNFNTEAIRETFVQTGNKIPNNSTELTLPRLLLDVARPFNFHDNMFGLQPIVGFEITFDGKRNTLLKTSLLSADVRAGLELHYKQMIFVRGGIGNFQQVKDISRQETTTSQASFGLGFRFGMFAIDYALTNFGSTNAGLASNVITLRVDVQQNKK